MKTKQPFEFKYKPYQLSLYDFFYIKEILSKDEYEVVIKNGKRKHSEYPLNKEDRTEAFVFNLEQKVVKYLTNLDTKWLNNKLIIGWCMRKLNISMEKLHLDIKEDNIIKPIGLKYEAPKFNEWTFINWILMEQLLTKGSTNEDTGVFQSGISWMLPVTYGKYTQGTNELQERYKYFLHELRLDESYPLLVAMNQQLQNIKANYAFIYNSDNASSESDSIMNAHSKMFGWLEVLRSLVANGKPFGTYVETKNSIAFEVLEFINSNSAHIKAENESYKVRTKK